jgi:hypothetical protein
MKIRNKAAAVLVALMFVGQAPANADFTGDFAVPNWTYSETDTSANGPTNSLTSTLMSITSADWSTGAVADTKGSYSITIPWNIGLITFEYSYTTQDVNGSFYDIPTYTAGGTETDIVASTNPSTVEQYGSTSGSVSLNTIGLWGTTLSINQKCNDCILGTATIRITGFRGVSLFDPHQLVAKSNASLSLATNTYTCKPGAYTLLRRGATAEAGAPTSLNYSLIIDGVRVSSVSSDKWATMSPWMLGDSNNSVTGTATLESATWTVAGAGTKSAKCEILAYQEHATTSTTSNGL